MYQKNVLYRARLAVTPEPWVTLFEGLLSIYLLWLALTQTYGASTDHVTRSVYHDLNVCPSDSFRQDTCYFPSTYCVLALTQTYGDSTDHVTRSVYHDFNVYPSESVRLDTCYDSLRVGLLFPEALFDTNNS